MDEKGYNAWWAAVKFSSAYGNKKFDKVAVDKIQYEYTSSKRGVTKRKAFKPQTLLDFDPLKWYVVWSSKDVPDKKEHPFYALIGRLAENEEDLTKEGLRRIAWPTVEEKNDEPDTNTESSAETPNPVLHQRQSRLNAKNAKHVAQQSQLQDYMKNTQLIPDVSGNGQHDCEMPSEEEGETGEAETIASLKEQIRKLKETASSDKDSFLACVKEEFASVHSTLRNIANSVSAVKAETDSLKSNVLNQEHELSKVQGAISQMETLIREGMTPIRSTNTPHSHVSSLTQPDEKVEWVQGSQVFIRETSLRAMATAKEFADWINAFLDGVFNEEEIPKMRTRKRKGSDITVIPPRIFLTAKRQFRLWLESLGKFDLIEIEHYEKTLGGMIGDVCLRRGGPRGIHGKIRKAEAAGQDTTALLADAKVQSAERASRMAAEGTPRRHRPRLGSKPIALPLALPPAVSDRPLSIGAAAESFITPQAEQRPGTSLQENTSLPIALSPVVTGDLVPPPGTLLSL